MFFSSYSCFNECQTKPISRRCSEEDVAAKTSRFLNICYSKFATESLEFLDEFMPKNTEKVEVSCLPDEEALSETNQRNIKDYCWIVENQPKLTQVWKKFLYQDLEVGYPL